jgi:predicted Zn-dependent protease
MSTFRRFLIFLAIALVTGCGPSIRFRPGEIPSPGATEPEYIYETQQFHAQLLQQQPVYYNPVAVRRVSRILDKLLDATPSTGHWTVTLLDDPAFNAMVAPGNYMYVFRGLLDKSRNDDEVAAVLAHEIGHRLAQHEIKTSGQIWGEAIAALATVAAGVAVAAQEGSTAQDVEDIMDMTNALGVGFTTLRYEKDQEREADQIGMFLMADAGINPMAAADVWAGRIAEEGAGGSDFFSTHPLHEDRYAMAVQLLPLAQVRYQEALKRRKSPERRRATPPAAVTYEIAQAQQALANNDLDTASNIARSLTAKAPSSPEVYNILGLIKATKGDTKQAHKAFERGLSIAPDDPILRYNVGCMHARHGERAQALRALQQAFTLQPSLTEGAREDPDLESLYDDPEFKALLEKQYIIPPPLDVGGNSFSVN